MPPAHIFLHGAICFGKAIIKPKNVQNATAQSFQYNTQITYYQALNIQLTPLNSNSQVDEKLVRVNGSSSYPVLDK